MHNAAHRVALVLASAATLATTACTRETEPRRATYTVEEYLAKPDVMATKLRECSNNPGELRNDPDCINVKDAVKQQGIGSYSKLPPLKFSKPGEGTVAADKSSTASR
jgi:hypothetical protein